MVDCSEDIAVSIIVLCYNTGSRLYETFLSIKNQRFTNYEIIVVDDCSTDNSIIEVEEIVSTLALKIVFVKNPVNSGISKSLNNALKHTKGKYIALIGDDQWHPNFLKDSINALELDGNEGYNFVFSRCETYNKVTAKIENNIDFLEVCKSAQYPRFPELAKGLSQDFIQIPDGLLFDILFWTNPMVAFCTIINKQLLVDCGKFEENYIMEDFPTWMNLSMKTSGIYLNKTLGTYIRYHTNVSNEYSEKIASDVFKKKKSLFRQIVFKDTKKRIANLIIDEVRKKETPPLKKLFSMIYWYSWKVRLIV